jgi:hypothetical protein
VLSFVVAAIATLPITLATRRRHTIAR